MANEPMVTNYCGMCEAAAKRIEALEAEHARSTDLLVARLVRADQLVEWAMREARNAASLEAENVMLKAGLRKIAGYARGGVVIKGEISGDRDEMIGIARQTLGAS